MASKRPVQNYAEESFSDEDDDDDQDIEYEQQERAHRRSSAAGRAAPRPADVVQELSPVQAAAVAANLSGAGSGRRRGRGPSKKAPLNRNALLARENRKRKKAYVKNIEEKLAAYHNRHKALAGVIENQRQQLEDLLGQVNYYRSLLSNQLEVTTLLVALNESLKALHGSKDTVPQSLSTKVADALKNINKTAEKYERSGCNVGVTTSRNVKSAPFSGVRSSGDYEEKFVDVIAGQLPQSFGEKILPKIARKTMPLSSAMSVGSSSQSIAPKSEEPSSVESLFVDDIDTNKFEQSPESHSYCNASPSETDLEALSNVNVGDFIFDNIEKETDSTTIVQPNDDQSHMFDEMLKNIDDNIPKLPSDEFDELLSVDETSKFNRTLFNTLNPPTGICLHINSCRVSLEYCHLCYKRSLEKFNASLSK